MRRPIHHSPRVLIVGAAGGIGRACAEVLGACGADLILADCDGTELTRVAEVTGARSRYCDAIGCVSVEVFTAELEQMVPSIDVLINAAGQGYVRALAMTRISRAVLPLLRRARGRRLIVNIPSAIGAARKSPIFPYASSHEAFSRLSDVLREQVQGSGIEVVRINPGRIQGQASESLWSDGAMAQRRADAFKTADRILDRIAMARPDWRQRRLPISRRA